MKKRVIRKEDGRRLIFYAFDRPLPPLLDQRVELVAEEERKEPAERRVGPRERRRCMMSEMRWHPFLRQWVVTAAHRQERTYKPPQRVLPSVSDAARRVSHRSAGVRIRDRRL